MDRQEMIEMLVDNLKRMNHYKVQSGEVTQERLDAFIAEQRERYEAMSDVQLRNMIVINF